jgi:hypothetical protein
MEFKNFHLTPPNAVLENTVAISLLSSLQLSNKKILERLNNSDINWSLMGYI